MELIDLIRQRAVIPLESKMMVCLFSLIFFVEALIYVL
jgi:hypothetical protein